MSVIISIGDLSESIKYSQENTKYYAPDEYPERKAAEIRRTKVKVTAERTLAAVKRLSEKHSGNFAVRFEFYAV